MSKSGITNDLAQWLLQVLNDQEDSRNELWDVAEHLVHVEGLTTHMYSLQHFQAHLKQLNKGFVRFLTHDYRDKFQHHDQVLDKTDFTNDTTASFVRVALASLLSGTFNKQMPSAALQIVAAIPDYSQYDKLTVTRRSQYMYHWHVMMGTVKNWFRYEEVFLKDIERLIQVRNGERMPRTFDEQVIWDTDLIYAHWFSQNPTWNGRAPVTPVGKAIFKLE